MVTLQKKERMTAQKSFIFDYLMMPEGWQFILWIVGLVFYIYIIDLTRKPLLQEDEDPLPTHE